MALIEVDWKPGPRQLRQFAGMFLVFALGAGTAVWLFRDWPTLVPRMLWLAGVVVGLGGLLFPPLCRPVYVALMAAALPIGFVVSSVMMVAIFFLVLTPIGLVMRLVGYDPMHRRFDRAAESYWLPRRPVADVRRYLRQY